MINTIKAKINLSFQDKNLKDIVLQSSVVFTAKVVATFLGLMFNLIVSRMYGAESIGKLALVNSFLVFSLIPSLAGIQISILRFIPEYIQKSSFFEAVRIYKKSLLIIFVLSLIVTLIFMNSSDLISIYFFKKPELTSLFTIASFFIIIKALGDFNQSAIRAFKDIKYFAWLSVLTPTFNIIILFLLGYMIKESNNPVYSVLLTSILIMLLSFIFVKKIIDKKNEIEVTTSSKRLKLKNIITTSFPMLLTSVMGIVLTQTDIVMLAMYSDMLQVGIYAIVVKLALLTTFILSSINVVVAPKFAEIFYSSDKSKLKKIVQSSSKLIFYSTLPIVLFLFLFGKFILGLFGEEFIAGYFAMCILLVGQLINISVGSVGYLMNMTGHHKQYNYIMIVGTIINISLNYVLIPIYGIEGAAFSSMFGILLINIIPLVYLKFKLNYYVGYLPINYKGVK